MVILTFPIWEEKKVMYNDNVQTENLMRLKEYNLAVYYLKKRIDKEPYDEEGYLNLLKVYLNMNDYASFIDYYKKIESIFVGELKVKLPLSIKKLYKKIL